MRGGGRIDLNGQGRPPSSKEPRLNAPGEILVLDPEGNLVVRSELDDAAEYEKLQERKKEPEEGRMGPGMYPGMEMMPGDEGLLMGPAQPGREPAKKAKDRRKTAREKPGTRERLMPRERPMKRR
jgi:hypothetical protein